MPKLRYGTGDELAKLEEAAGISAPSPAPSAAPAPAPKSGAPKQPKSFKAGKLYPLSSIPWAEPAGSGRANEPANGGYQHNSPAKPL